MKKIGSIFQVASERRALREVPDHVLRDIGLTRIDAEREAAWAEYYQENPDEAPDAAAAEAPAEEAAAEEA